MRRTGAYMPNCCKTAPSSSTRWITPLTTALLPGKPYRGAPLDELGPWIDDALDLIEFANGGAETVWGGARAGLGHPEPFGLEYLAIGNEEVGTGHGAVSVGVLLCGGTAKTL